MEETAPLKAPFEAQGKQGAAPNLQTSSRRNALRETRTLKNEGCGTRPMRPQLARETLTDGRRKATSSAGKSRSLMETMMYCCQFSMGMGEPLCGAGMNTAPQKYT